MNPSLEQFLESARGVMPAWPLEIVPHIDVDWSSTSSEQVAWLAASLAKAHPEAGRHYWAFRTWSLLVWQPVYLTLAGVHLKRLGILPEYIGQQASPCMVWGCRIGDHVPLEAEEGALLTAASAALREGAGRLFGTCSTVTDLHPKAAGRLLADYVTGAMLRMKDLRPDWSADVAVAWGERWLDALGLQGAGGFLRYGDANGDQRLAIDRKVCCLVYKCHDGSLCETCPKIPLGDRLVRLAHR